VNTVGIPSIFIKGGALIDQMSDYQLLQASEIN
jgi:hypothetical protein